MKMNNRTKVTIKLKSLSLLPDESIVTKKSNGNGVTF